MERRINEAQLPLDGRPAGPPPAHGRLRSAAAIAAATLGVLVLFSGGAGVGWAVTKARAVATAGQPAGPLRAVPQVTAGGGLLGGLDASSVARKVSPGVVDINTVVAGGGRAAGTGMLLTSSGQVLTNHHVVEGATSIEVTIAGQSGAHAAHVLGVDTGSDVALIQVDGLSGQRTVTLANTTALRVGQPVVAIGNALGQGGAPAVTQGHITALEQSITAGSAGGAEQLSGLIQTDASISPGDSGGPLANAAGQVIGMITAGATQGRRQTSTTVGFAIPASAALQIVNQIRSGRAAGTVIIGQPGFLGVSVGDLDASTAARLGLDISSGALVTTVVAGSPAEGAGLSRYAVITAIDGAGIGSASQLGPAIRAHKPGQAIQVAWVDRAGAHSATVTLTGGPVA